MASPARWAGGSVLVLLLAAPLAAAQRRETLIYSQFDIDPGEWRYFEFPSKEKDARLRVEYKVEAPPNSSGVRVAVVTESEFLKLRQNQPHKEIRSSAYRRQGELRTPLPDPGGYAVVIDNRLEGRRKYRVDLDVSLITGPDPETLPVGYISPERRRVVVTASIAGFLLILGLAGQALWRATRRRGREINFQV
jgi:hypothetical protein